MIMATSATSRHTKYEFPSKRITIAFGGHTSKTLFRRKYRNRKYVVRRDSDADEGHVCFKNAEDVEFVIANPNFREILDILLKH